MPLLSKPPARSFWTFRFFTLLVVLLAAPSRALEAQPDARKEALLALEASADTHLGTYRNGARAERRDVFTALADLEAKALAGTAVLADVDAFAAVLATFQHHMRDRLQTAIDGIGIDTMTIHANLSAAAVPFDDWPRGLHKGDGGLTDRIRAEAEDFTEWFIEKVEQKIQKTAKQLRKYAGISLTVRLEPPLPFVDWAVHQAGGSAVSSGNTFFEIDMLLAASQVGVASDGRIHVAGTAHSADGDVTLRAIFGDSTLASEDVTPGQFTHRFTWKFTGTFIGKQEGQYLVEARHGSAVTHVTRTISVR